MKQIIFITFCLFILIIVGCADSTTSLLNPKSDIHVMVGTPAMTAEVQIEKEDDGTIKSITLSEQRFDFAIYNGVSAFLEEVEIHYFDKFGNEILSPLLAQKFGVTLYVKAPDIKKRGAGSGASGSDSSGGGDSGGGGSAKIMAATTQEALPDTAGSLNVMVMTGEVFDYIHNNTLNTTADDNTPIQARLTFRGRDVNGNSIECYASVRLDNISTSGEE
ncbi:hypothetical protein ACFL35_11120 [Candidatus Riflebacteria bacterium]